MNRNAVLLLSCCLPWLAVNAVEVEPELIRNHRYEYKLTFDDLGRESLPYEFEKLENLHYFQDGTAQSARRFLLAERGKSEAELVLKVDFSRAGEVPRKVKIEERPALFGGTAKPVELTTEYSTDGVHYRPLSQIKKSGAVNGGRSVELSDRPQTFFYRCRMKSDQGAFAGTRNQWGRCAPGQNAFVLAFDTVPAPGGTTGAAIRGEAAASAPLTLKSGSYHLLHAGSYRLGILMNGAEPRRLPTGWSALTFDEVPEGMIFAVNPWGRQRGRDNMILHPPYRGAKGISYLEYDLSLPASQKARLQLGFAMMEDKVPKSDGVTFRVKVKEQNGRAFQTLFEKHYGAAEWLDQSFDLTKFAGRTLTLRLETDPGPAKNAGWDYALISDPVILIGNGPFDSLAKKLLAVGAKSSLSVAGLENTNTVGVRPSTPKPYSNMLSETVDGYRFVCRDAQKEEMSAVWDTRVPYLGGLAVQYRGESFRAFAGSGPQFPGNGAARRQLLKKFADGDSATIVERYSDSGRAVILTTTVAMKGRSLLVDTQADRPELAALNYGEIAGIPWMTSLNIPPLRIKQFAYLHNGNAFLSFVQDWSESFASGYGFRKMEYGVDTQGARNPVRERAVLTLAPSLAEVFPNIPNPPSPYRAQLAGSLVADLWRDHFDEQTVQLEKLALYGIRNLFVIKHIWQKYGLDEAFPETTPANAVMGGDAGLRRMSMTAQKLGYGFGIHDNYVDFYKNASDWNPRDVVLQADGKPSPAWKNSRGNQSFNMKASRMTDYAMRHASDIRARYETTGTFVDVHASTAPWERPFDMEHGQPLAGMFRNSYLGNIALFQQLRAIHQGPVFSEGGRTHFLWAGYLDGVEGALDGGEKAVLAVDFELLKVKPLQLNRGMGYYERFLSSGYESPEWPHFPGSSAQQDQYRALEVAYGHLGLLSCQLFKQLSVAVREYYLVTALSRRYSMSPLREIAYEINGHLVPGGIAAVLGGGKRVRLRYENDLTIWVNLEDSTWRIDGETIAPKGFLGKAPGCIAGNLIRDGRIVDYRNADGIVYANARTYNEFTAKARDAHAELLKTDVKLTGKRSFELTYQIRMLRPVARGGNLLSEMSSGGRVLFRFQAVPGKALEHCKSGDVITAGPCRVTLPDNLPDGEYKIWTALPTDNLLRPDLFGYWRYNSDAYGYAMPVFRLKQGALSVHAPEPLPVAGAPLRFSERRTPVDFGPVATDGAVVVESIGGYRRVVPVPLDDAIQIRLPRAKRCEAFDAAGKSLGVVALSSNGEFRTHVPGAAEYRVWE